MAVVPKLQPAGQIRPASKFGQVPEQYQRCILIFFFQTFVFDLFKPFTFGEFVKKCMNDVAEEVCLRKKDIFNAVSLSESTITRRIEEIGGNVYAQLQQETKEFDFFSFALEITDVQDTAWHN